MAELRLGTRVGAETAHELELQLIHALVECLSAGSSDEATPASRRQGNCGPLRGFVAADYRFEALPGVCYFAAVRVPQRDTALLLDHLAHHPV
jgi:hypothetical protein